MIKSKHIFLLLLAISFLASCGSSRSIAAKKKVASTKSKLERQYKLYKGTPYRYGGTTKKGFDCSGFVGKVYKDALKIQLPRTTKQIATKGRKVSKKNLKVGDLLFFRPTRRYRHVGIYMGNGYFMHSSTSKGVIKSRLDNVYWKKKYKQARRIL